MDVETAIKERKSVRAFKDDPVPDYLIRSIIDLGLMAPSWGNTQPWEITVVTGGKVKKLKKCFREKYERDEIPNPDFPLPTDKEWPEKCLKRYKTLGKSLFEMLGISREDHVLRRKHYLHMFQGFGAPVFIYICLDKKLTKWAMLDVGIIIQTICLAAVAKGLCSIVLTHLVLYPDVIRTVLQIPDSKYIVMGIALGYPDISAGVNSFRSTREDRNEIVRFING